VRDTEYDFAIRAYAHTIARFERRAAAVETTVVAAPDPESTVTVIAFAH
jgi:hypothetical protein